MRKRKVETLRENLAASGVAAGENDHCVRVLSSCPACVQGLSRYADETGLATDYIVVELARAKLGEDWTREFVERASRGGEQVLL